MSPSATSSQPSSRMPHSKPSRASLTSSFTLRSDPMPPSQLLVAALEADPVATMDHAVGDHAAGDSPSAGLDRHAHFGVTVDHLLVARLEHAREHLLDVFDQRVDDVVLA